MDDRIPGTDPPQISSTDAVDVLSCPAEVRAFRRFLAGSDDQSLEGRSAIDIWLRERAPRWHRRRQLTAAELQAEEIRKHRWIESEKKKADVGKKAHLDWVTTYAAQWRDWFEHHYDGPLVDCD